MMEFVNGKDDIPYMKWKIKAMFQTTNQLYIHQSGGGCSHGPQNYAKSSTQHI
jgi:hypothetical protein